MKFYCTIGALVITSIHAIDSTVVPTVAPTNRALKIPTKRLIIGTTAPETTADSGDAFMVGALGPVPSIAVPATSEPVPAIAISSDITVTPVSTVPVANITLLAATTLAPAAQPTVKPDPSFAPTDTYAPSPSPSASPTRTPTGTVGPSPSPSIIPTDSPAPSPSPSSSPSAIPSASPSKSPSGEPSISPTSLPSGIPSVGPTRAPSLHPSISPSSKPSISGVPSFSPSISNVPTSPTTSPSLDPTSRPSSGPSQVPSTLPTTAVTVLSARVAVTLHIFGKTMNKDVTKVFEQQTKEFLQTQVDSDTYYPEVAITIVSVEMAEQTYIPARRLSSGRRLHDAGLRIRFQVTGEVRPGVPPQDFSFATAVEEPFNKEEPTYNYRLSAANPFFNPLTDKEDAVNALSTEGSRSAGNKIGKGGFAGIIVSVIGAVALAVVAAIYAVRGRNRDSDSVVGGAKIDICALERCDSHSTAMTPYGVPDSPGSLESGFYPSKKYKTVENRSQVTEQAQARSLLDAIVNQSASTETEDQSEALGLKLSSDVLAAHASSSNRADPPANSRANTTPIISLQVPTMGSSFCYSDDDTNRSDCMTPVSVIESPAVNRAKGSVLGARPMEHTEKEQFKERSSYESSTVKRSGLYDVFAPPGPLGIVVDTTRDGPVVHSMKPTSPLLGLISPGDLIVGLDDVDTRSMTAATLTRAMAKQAHASERKITLLAVENN